MMELVRGAPEIRAKVFETVQAALYAEVPPSSHAGACLALLGIWAGVVRPMDVPGEPLAMAIMDERISAIEKGLTRPWYLP